MRGWGAVSTIVWANVIAQGVVDVIVATVGVVALVDGCRRVRRGNVTRRWLAANFAIGVVSVAAVVTTAPLPTMDDAAATDARLAAMAVTLADVPPNWNQYPRPQHHVGRIQHQGNVSLITCLGIQRSVRAVGDYNAPDLAIGAGRTYRRVRDMAIEYATADAARRVYDALAGQRHLDCERRSFLDQGLPPTAALSAASLASPGNLPNVVAARFTYDLTLAGGGQGLMIEDQIDLFVGKALATVEFSSVDEAMDPAFEASIVQTVRARMVGAEGVRV